MGFQVVLKCALAFAARWAACGVRPLRRMHGLERSEQRPPGGARRHSMHRVTRRGRAAAHIPARAAAGLGPHSSALFFHCGGSLGSDADSSGGCKSGKGAGRSNVAGSPAPGPQKRARGSRAGKTRRAPWRAGSRRAGLCFRRSAPAGRRRPGGGSPFFPLFLSLICCCSLLAAPRGPREYLRRGAQIFRGCRPGARRGTRGTTAPCRPWCTPGRA